MKRIILLLATVLVIWSACDKQLEGYIVAGTFKNSDNELVYLYRTLGSKLVAIDSTTVAADGKFEFTGHLPNTEFLLLSVVSKDKKVTQNIQLLVGSEDVLLFEGDLSGNLSRNFTIAGSRETMFVQELNQHLLATATELDSLAKQFRESVADSKLDSAAKAQFDTRNKIILEKHRAFSESFINKHDSSLVSVIALFQSYNSFEQVFRMENDLTLFKKVAAKMDQFNPNSDLTKTLKMHILAFENRKQEQTAEKSLVAVGQMAPEVMIPGIDGKEISLSMFRGNYVLLDFWAAWCRPCRAENPNLAAVYKRYHTKGLVIFQISLDKNRADWLKAIRDDKLNWVHGCDFGFWETASARLYNVASIPTNFLIDPSGKIVATNLRGAELTKKMKEVYLY